MDLDELYPSKHASIVGRTGTGKSYLAKKLHKKCSNPSFYIHSGDELNVYGSRANSRTNLLNCDQKVNFETSIDFETSNKEIEGIYRFLKKYVPKKITKYIFIEESHLYAPEKKGKTALDTIVRRGRKFNVKAFIISQSPADIKKSILKQCTEHIIFDLGEYETKYFQKYRLPYEEIKQRLNNCEHCFVLYRNNDLYGAFKI